MKIGLLTFNNTTNFGSVLQCFALYKAISNFGADCEIIDYDCEAVLKNESLSGNKGRNPIKNLARYLLFGKDIKKKNLLLSKFIKTNASISKNKYNKINITDANLIYDVFVVGSDIVWGFDITGGDMNYLLSFASESKRRIAFSSSMGKQWDDCYIEKAKIELSKFESIFLREEDAVVFLSKIGFESAQLVCDPTMLFDSCFWLKYVSKDPIIKRDYVLVYFYTDELIQKAKEYSRLKNKLLVVINYGLPIKGVKNVRPKTVESFLNLIKYSYFVFTGSYHGFLFSLYFKKQYALFNRAHKSRMENVIKRLKLPDRFVSDLNTYDQIDYSAIDNEINNFRKESLDKLKGCIRCL